VPDLLFPSEENPTIYSHANLLIFCAPRFLQPTILDRSAINESTLIIIRGDKMGRECNTNLTFPWR
jgi:hypothetical protein